jgi:MFS family permease
VQLLVYALLQVPVGVLIDRYGSKRLIIAGSLVMAGAQAMFAVAQSLPLAYAARIILGLGDALTSLVLQLVTPSGSTDYSLSAFKWAFATQYVLWALGIFQTLPYRRRVERLLAERDPQALEALRRGVPLPPPS